MSRKKVERYKVAGLAMVGAEAPNTALKTLLEEGKPFVEVDRSRFETEAPVATLAQIVAMVRR